MSLKGSKGVDVSYANGNIDMSKVKSAGYKFVMIRCGYGSDLSYQDDSYFASNVKKAESLGLPWGVYLYSYATNVSEAKSEVAHITRLLKGKKPTMPVAIDVEDTAYYQKHGCYNKTALTQIVSTILSGIKSAGFYPMLYTGRYWLDGYGGSSGMISKDVWSKYDLWIACWTSSCLYSGSNLGMWQYGGETCVYSGETCSPKNSIPGVGVIDKDLVYFDYPEIIKSKGYNGWPSGSSGGGGTSGGGSSGGGSSSGGTTSLPKVTYRSRFGGKWGKEITDLKDFSGVDNTSITDVAIKVSEGTIEYRVHVKGGSWLPKVTGYNINDSANGYAGNGKPIDAIEVYYKTPSSVVSKSGYLKAAYRVSVLNTTAYYGFQYDNEKTNGQDGYAGCFGKAIDKFQIKLTKGTV